MWLSHTYSLLARRFTRWAAGAPPSVGVPGPASNLSNCSTGTNWSRGGPTYRWKWPPCLHRGVAGGGQRGGWDTGGKAGTRERRAAHPPTHAKHIAHRHSRPLQQRGTSTPTCSTSMHTLYQHLHARTHAQAPRGTSTQGHKAGDEPLEQHAPKETHTVTGYPAPPSTRATHLTHMPSTKNTLLPTAYLQFVHMPSTPWASGRPRGRRCASLG